MAHLHSVNDSDAYFIVDTTKRTIKNKTPKRTVMQYDHNSERFTFELDQRYVDGHDMSTCNEVEVHYNNGGNLGLYLVEDLRVSEDDSGMVLCSWLISRNATMKAAPLEFRLTFKCVSDGMVDYEWSTAVFRGITVAPGVRSTEMIAELFPDLITQIIDKILQEIIRIENFETIIKELLKEENLETIIQEIIKGEHLETIIKEILEKENLETIIQEIIKEGNIETIIQEILNEEHLETIIQEIINGDNLETIVQEVVQEIIESEHIDTIIQEILKTENLEKIFEEMVKNGLNGVDGYTPVRGVDYYTEEDKDEIVERVIEALDKWDEVSF